MPFRRLAVALSIIFLPVTAFAFAPNPQDVLLPTLSVEVSPVRMDSVPRGAVRVNMLNVKFSASCEGDVQIKYLRVKKEGLGDIADIRRVYLMRELHRLSRPTMFKTSDQTAVLRTSRLTIPACQTVEARVAVDFARSSAVGGRHLLSIEGVTDIVSTATRVQINFPIVSNVRSASITPEPAGTIEATFLPIHSISVVRDEILAKMLLHADNESNHIIQAITLTNEGSAKNDDLRNLYITHSRGRALTPLVKHMDGDEVTFKFSQPYFLKRGASILFQIRGNAYTSQRTVQFGLKEPSDLNAQPSRRGLREKGRPQGY